ncbi:tetratricopeptide repeat protein [Nafulsella turpanensis]|uniref:tetratricopeptide repeat protein n=1 Tax=Nafulsella turpanensis TaxID=1265690 RepID=UPI000349F54C|nr:tetratricopeptide repeat protein [Nafulsella turpanensis]
MKAFKYCFLLIFGMGLLFSTPSFSQQFSVRDQEEIAYQARQTLNMYQDLLNVISYKGLANPSEIQKMIRDSYTESRSRIFYSEAAIIEDNVNPANIGASSRQDKAVADYLKYFDLAYEKEEEATVEFSDFETSHLKFSSYPYIKVKYTSLFKGSHKEDTTDYKAVDRVAELRAEKEGGKWKTYITSILYYDPQEPFNSSEGNVELDQSNSGNSTFASLSKEVAGSASRPVGGGARSAEKDSVFNHQIRVGEAALAAEQLDKAFTAFSAAGKIYPDHPDLRKNLLELARAQNNLISRPEAGFAELKRMADKAFEARLYGEAKNLYSEALRLKPEEEQLKVKIEKLERIIRQLALLESKYLAGEYKQAIKDYNKAIREDQSNPDFYYGRGKVFEQQGEIKKALEDYSRAIALDGNFIQALRARASLFTETQQFYEAVADYSLLLSDPDNRAAFYPERAEVKKKMGDLKGALEDYTAAIRYNPEVAPFYFEKGMLLLALKNEEEAIQAFTSAIEIDAQQPSFFFQRGMANAAIGNLKEASSDFEVARRLGLKEEQKNSIQELALSYYSRGEGAMDNKKFGEAVDSFSRALLIAPGEGRFWLRKGDAFFALQAYDSAIEHYTHAVKYDSLSFALFRRGLAYQKKGEEGLALDNFRRYIPIGQQVIARAEEVGEGKIPIASGRFVEEVAAAWYALGYAQLINRQFKEAIESLQNAIEERKFYPEAYFARGSAYFAIGDFKRAVKDMEESIRMGLSDPEVFFALGKAYVANDQQKDAVFSYSHAIKLDPAYEEAYKERAFSYLYFQQYDLALQDLKKALSLNENLKNDVELMVEKGFAELRLNKLKEAKESFEQALRLDGNHAWALFGKAAVLGQEGKQEESLDLYRQAFQTGKIEWADIKNDPILRQTRKEKAFKELVKAYF